MFQNSRTKVLSPVAGAVSRTEMPPQRQSRRRCSEIEECLRQQHRARKDASTMLLSDIGASANVDLYIKYTASLQETVHRGRLPLGCQADLRQQEKQTARKLSGDSVCLDPVNINTPPCTKGRYLLGHLLLALKHQTNQKDESHYTDQPRICPLRRRLDSQYRIDIHGPSLLRALVLRSRKSLSRERNRKERG